MKKLKIGIVGCGAIGTSLARAITRDLSSRAVLAAVYDKDLSKTDDLRRRTGVPSSRVVRDIDALIGRSDLVIECASANVSGQVARRCLRAGRDVMIMSAGGILGEIEALRRLATRQGRRVYIPSGAIAGVDAVRAARESGITRAVLETRKPPKAFEGVEYVNKKNISLTGIREDTVLFEGPARDAVRFFPQNINVAAVLSLSGIGEDRTLVRIVASPSEKCNVHQVRVESAAGVVTTRVENVLHPDNPKTSFLAVLSAVALLRRILDPIGVGA